MSDILYIRRGLLSGLMKSETKVEVDEMRRLYLDMVINIIETQNQIAG